MAQVEGVKLHACAGQKRSSQLIVLCVAFPTIVNVSLWIKAFAKLLKCSVNVPDGIIIYVPSAHYQNVFP